MRGAFALSAADLKERVVLDCRFVGVEPAAGRIFLLRHVTYTNVSVHSSSQIIGK
jgi:hypothetical protein